MALALGCSSDPSGPPRTLGRADAGAQDAPAVADAAPQGGPATTDSGTTGVIAADAGPTDLGTPRPVPLVAKRVAVGVESACAVLFDETVRCWGRHTTAPTVDVANRTSITAVPLPGPVQITEVSSGTWTNCALGTPGVWCWGTVVQESAEIAYVEPTALAFARISTLAVGNGRTCAISDGSLWCWDSSQPTASGLLSMPVQVAGLTSVTDIDVGPQHVCAVADGRVWCWGDNSRGQFGDRTTRFSQIPVQVPGLSAVAKVAAGGVHTCALLLDGTARCWGHNPNGQLGIGSVQDVPTPAPVAGLSGVTDLDVGQQFTCAIAGGEVYCWGANNLGQLGAATADERSLLPRQVMGLHGATLISVGFDSACVLTEMGAVWCWGSNDSGQLGNGTLDASSPRPAPVLTR